MTQHLLRYFLLTIFAFAIALALIPYFRDKLSFLTAALLRLQKSALQWHVNNCLSLGRYFFRIYKKHDASGRHPIPHYDGELVDEDNKDVVVMGALTPINNVEDIKLYERELVDKLNDKSVRNIAITGPYGSGKSSLINTFFFRNPQFRPLYVSLAAFKDERKQAVTEEKKENAENGSGRFKNIFSNEQVVISPEQQKVIDDRIEYSILQQLFYHVRGKDVPFSRLKRIRTVKRGRLARLAFLVAIYGICLLFIYLPKWLPGYSRWSALIESMTWLHFTAIGGVTIGTIYLVYLVFKFQQNASMIKLNLDKAQLEISPDKGASVLNQHMDEIVYYFSATRHDLLVIEDVDRFKNPEIFVKLREINTLINNSLQVNRKVTFIYALRDDVFVDESRTKFFDFILPVIPVTNAVSSAAILISRFESLNLKTPIPQNFLNDLALFITDRRLIQNIFNEFVVYNSQLDNSTLVPARLLAMIVYKNLHPTDFSALQANEGWVYDLFQNKGKIVEELVAEKEKEGERLKKEIQAVESEFANNLHELRLLYLGKFYDLLSEEFSAFEGRITISGNGYNFHEALKEEVFELIPVARSVSFRTMGSPRKMDLDRVEKAINPHITYLERKRNVEQKGETELYRLKSEQKRYRDEIFAIRDSSISALLKFKKLQTIKTPINEYPALAYLVGRGHIGEDYWLYISAFKPGQLTENDYKFIAALKSSTPMPADHQLYNIGEVVKRLDHQDCELAEALNYDLLSYLLSTRKPESLLQLLIRQLAQLRDEDWAYLESFRRQVNAPFNLLIGELFHISPDLWLFVKANAAKTNGDPDIYLTAIIATVKMDTIIRMNKLDEFVSDFNSSSFLMEGPGENYFSSLKPILDRLDIKFRKAPLVPVEGDFLRYVLENNHYAINMEMVDFMHELVDEGIAQKGYENQLHNILNDKIDYISDYVGGQIEVYVTEVFLKRGIDHKEDPQVFTDLLNYGELSSTAKERIMQEKEFNLSNLSDVNEEYFDQIIKYGRFVASWSNLLTYRKYKGDAVLSEELLTFLSTPSAYTHLSSEKIVDDGSDDCLLIRELLIDLIQDSRLSHEAKLAIIDVWEERLAFRSFAGIQNPVLEKMIAKERISLTYQTLQALKDVGFQVFMIVIRRNWDLAIIELDANLLGLRGYIALLFSDESLTEKQKNQIYDTLKADILVQLLEKGYTLPTGVIQRPHLKLDLEQLSRLGGKVTNEEIIVAILGAHEDLLNETLVRELLDPLPGSFKKILKQDGKELNKSPLIVRLLEILKRVNILVEDYEVKLRIVTITWIKNS